MIYMWTFLQYALLPHPTNNHRPKALHPGSLAFYAVLLLILHASLPILHKYYPDVLGFATDIHVERLLEETNKQRSSSSLQPLTLNPQLSQAAVMKAKDMFSKNYWAHNSPQGRTPWGFIIDSGYKYSLAGENLAKNFEESGGVVSAWMASATHRDNILKPDYQEVGFAVVNGELNGEETTLVVQMFGTAQNALSRGSIAQAPAYQQNQAGAIQNTALPTSDSNVEIDQNAVQVVSSPTRQAFGVATIFSDVTKNPLINIKFLTRNVAAIVIGFLLLILGVDTILIAKRKVVRIAGHNIAHILFFAGLLIALGSILPGSIL